MKAILPAGLNKHLECLKETFWAPCYGVSLRTKINLKIDLLGEINSDIKNMCSNKQNATLKQKIMVQDNKKNVVLDLKIKNKPKKR